MQKRCRKWIPEPAWNYMKTETSWRQSGQTVTCNGAHTCIICKMSGWQTWLVVILQYAGRYCITLNSTNYFIKIICCSHSTLQHSTDNSTESNRRASSVSIQLQADNTLTSSRLCLKYPQTMKPACVTTGEMDMMTFLKHHLLRSTTTARPDEPVRPKESRSLTPTVFRCTASRKAQCLHFVSLEILSCVHNDSI